MKFTDRSVYTRVTRHIDVEQGPALSGMYGSKTGRVTRVSINYVALDRSDKWEAQGIHVSGVVLKADQTDSKNTFSTLVGSYDLNQSPARWEWLANLIDMARPTSVPLIPSPFEDREF
jgi:hypothetical protein